MMTDTEQKALEASLEAMSIARPALDENFLRLEPVLDAAIALARAALAAPVVAPPEPVAPIEEPKDAARYRWLREQDVVWYPPGYNGNPNCYWQAEFFSSVSESLDAAIDAAIHASQKGPSLQVAAPAPPTNDLDDLQLTLQAWGNADTKGGGDGMDLIKGLLLRAEAAIAALRAPVAAPPTQDQG